jgi:hypothetical protein
MSAYKLINSVLFKDDKPCYCPEKGVVPISYIDEKASKLAMNGNGRPQVKTNLQHFFCMENCAKFVKIESADFKKGIMTQSEGRLGCCPGNVSFVIESEENKVAEPNKNVN